jgi:hypothetical protein
MRACAFLLFAGCQTPLSLSFTVGPVQADVDANDLSIPPEMSDGTTILSVACPPAECPSDATSGFQSTCVGGVCDPSADVTVDIGVVDLSDYQDLSTLGDALSAAEIEAVHYTVDANTLDVDLPPTDVFWAPESVTTFDDPSVRGLGTVPATPAGTTPSGDMDSDDAGQAALTDYLLSQSTSALRFRLFARATIDLEPGQAVPTGALSLGVSMDVRLEGGL